MALKPLLARTTPLDRLIVAVLLGLCLVLFVMIGARPPGQTVEVLRNGKIFFKAPLDEERTVELQGPLGATRLEIHHGQARILSSPCPFKVCLGMGPISQRGEIIACVPNRLLVTVAGGEATGKEREYDLLSR